MKELTIEELEVLLCSTGYLPPRNDEELTFFNEMYDGYKSRLEDRHVDVDAIICGSCEVGSKYQLPEDSQDSYMGKVAEDIHGKYSMAARNFGNLPKSVLDKMRKQHNIDDENED